MQATKLLGVSPLTVNYAYTCGFLNPVYAQGLRWKRKPIWLPTAKTKVFRVPKRPSIPEDEFQEIQRLYKNYKTYMRSTIEYIKKLQQANEVQLDPAVVEKAETQDFENCCKINEEWNKQIALERSERLQIAKEEKKLKILQSVEKKKAKDEMKRLEAEESLKKLKAIVPTFITRSNIDEAIEKALASPVVNYNKAIDINGNWYTDTTGLPPTKELSQKPVEAKQ